MRHGRLPKDEQSGLYQVDVETLRVIALWHDGLPLASRVAEKMGLEGGEATVRARLKRLVASGHVVRKSLGNGLPTIPFVTHTGRKAAKLIDEPPRIVDYEPDFSRPMPIVPLPCGPLGEASGEVEHVTHPFTDWRPGDYLAYADGDSMYNPLSRTGFPRGAKVQMRPGVFPQSGDVVHIDVIDESGQHECTMKVFHQTKSRAPSR